MISYYLTYGFSCIELYLSAKRVDGFRWRDKIYVYNVLAFGLKSAPYAFAKTIYVLIAHLRYKSIKALPYLYNFMFSVIWRPTFFA
jgi:hypothetical protein